MPTLAASFQFGLVHFCVQKTHYIWGNCPVGIFKAEREGTDRASSPVLERRGVEPRDHHFDVVQGSRGPLSQMLIVDSSLILSPLVSAIQILGFVLILYFVLPMLELRRSASARPFQNFVDVEVCPTNAQACDKHVARHSGYIQFKTRPRMMSSILDIYQVHI